MQQGKDHPHELRCIGTRLYSPKKIEKKDAKLGDRLFAGY